GSFSQSSSGSAPPLSNHTSKTQPSTSLSPNSSPPSPRLFGIIYFTRSWCLKRHKSSLLVFAILRAYGTHSNRRPHHQHQHRSLRRTSRDLSSRSRFKK